METLYYHGDVVTMEQRDDSPEAVLVRDGIIAAVGNLADLEQLAEPTCQRKDLRGATLMPSFIDTHGHLSMTTQYVVMADLSSAESFADIVQLLLEFRQKNDLTHGEAIFGYSYDHNFLQEQAHPTRDVLDQVSTEVPVAIWHMSVHMAVVNSKALELMHIDETTPDPEGGLIARYEGTNQPTGYLEETAAASVRQLQAEIPMDFAAQIEEAQMQYIRHGITTVQDGAADYASVAMCRRMAAEGRLKIDVVAYPCFNLGLGIGDSMEQNKDCIGHYVNGYKIGGYKSVLDGSPQCKSAWMTKPYEHSGDACGYPWMTDEELEAQITRAVDENQQILVHCNGDAAADQYLRVYETVLGKSDNPQKDQLRPVMIHCQTVREDQLDKMQQLHIIPSIFVAHVNYWGDVHLKNFGSERGSRISPVRSALNRGLCYNFHTDTPVVQPNLFHSVWTAVNRRTRNGVTCGPEQCIDVYDALKAVTIHAAYEYSEEDSKGSIKPGKRADLIIVDQNPLNIDPMELRNVQVLETIKDGVSIYQSTASQKIY